MLFHMGRNVEVARRRAHRARISFTRDTQPGTVLRARRNAYFDRFRMRKPAFAVTRRAGVLQPALAVAPRASQVELHVAGHLTDVAGTAALRACDGTRVVASRAVARGALVVSGDVDLCLSSADCLPEADIEPIFEIGSAFRFLLDLVSAASVEELAENIFERARPSAATAPP